MKNKIRPIAIYLPQFHPIPENDEWWGKGFTEWTNVVKGKPIFNGHYQPHLPADLGFYDIRLPEVREAQAKMAKDHGIYGFCYYHYWFNGKRLLNSPIDEVLETENPDFPFCLCWANENWTRRWDGMNNQILIKQEYSNEDDKKHVQFLFKFFKDRRYIKVDGKPVFIIYRPELFPDVKLTTETFRNEARLAGIGELYLCYFEHKFFNIEPASMGFDAAIEFHPRPHYFPPNIKGNIFSRILNKLKIRKSKYAVNKIIDYSFYANNAIKQLQSLKIKKYHCVTPMWDNTARRKSGALIFKDSTPQLYENWLRNVIKNFRPFSPEENLVFINAWNEWAEGNHLEPCQKWKNDYLTATFDVLNDETIK